MTARDDAVEGPHIGEEDAVEEIDASIVETEEGVTELQTLCLSCYENGVTRLLVTKIPHFKEVIIMSFECPHCHCKNCEVQSGAALEAKGVEFDLEVTSKEDLDRQIIKSEHATIFVPSLEFEIPPNTQRGVCSTVEGILSHAAAALESQQSVRHTRDPEVALQLDTVIARLKSYASGDTLPFHVVLEDPSGNSHIESCNPHTDTLLKTRRFERTKEQLHQLGFYEAQPDEPKGADLPDHLRVKGAWNLNVSVEENLKGERDGICFAVECPHCGQMGENNMCDIDIPGFRRCMIMAFVCDYCGAKSNEVKPIGAYGEKARRWTLRVESEADLNRDVLKGDTAAVRIPVVDFEMCTGTQGGMFTTVEGLVRKMAENLRDVFPFSGDSAPEDEQKKMDNAISSLLKLVEDPSSLPFTLILDDAADLSFIGSRDVRIRTVQEKEEGESEKKKEMEDQQLTSEVYQRSDEQNDELGLLDMRVENYEGDGVAVLEEVKEKEQR